ncbi:hypothetical protein [Mesorhizobium sp. LNJC405B00]|uniref:hypothetical protein n=1 Tax=Mesorhizobium sp. LNJC405B00 TaxID=1287281 RepID=UPI0003CF20A5|nr:hypothetical protein [Mesorhizobium sp. LNJC405B00]ESY01491.1 hypothetical protein X755_06750 [Mesorhizobium sp. LNJC405B00]
MTEITIKNFDRSLPDRFVVQLEEAAEKGWWRDVLEDRELVIGLRGKSLNVYWKGQSIFKVEAGPLSLRASTHEKFLLDPKLGGQIDFDGEKFDVAALGTKAFLKHYEGPASLALIKRAAGIYSGREKRGCHSIAIANSQVIDVEIALPGSVERNEPGDEVTSPRIDLLALEPRGTDEARLVFWEAKDFKNAELGSIRSRLPAPVLAQIAAYRAILDGYRHDLEESYTRLCSNLRRIRGAAGQGVHPLVDEIAAGTRKVTLGDAPQVNLLVFGFDAGQKDYADWQAHRAALEHALAADGGRLYAVGDPKGKRL